MHALYTYQPGYIQSIHLSFTEWKEKSQSFPADLEISTLEKKYLKQATQENIFVSVSKKCQYLTRSFLKVLIGHQLVEMLYWMDRIKLEWLCKNINP